MKKKNLKKTKSYLQEILTHTKKRPVKIGTRFDPSPGNQPEPPILPPLSLLIIITKQ